MCGGMNRVCEANEYAPFLPLRLLLCGTMVERIERLDEKALVLRHGVTKGYV